MDAETETKPEKRRTKKKAKQQQELSDEPAPMVAGNRVLRVITEQLPVPLTRKESRQQGQKLAQLEGELDGHEARAAQVKAELKARESEIRAQIASAAMQIRNGTKVVDVPVQLEADYEQGVVRYLRVDTKEEIRTRPLDEAERQTPLFEEAADALPRGDKPGPDITTPLPSGVTPATETEP